MLTPVLATNTITCTGTSCVNLNIYMDNTTDYEFILSSKTKILINPTYNGNFTISLKTASISNPPEDINIQATLFNENFSIKISPGLKATIKTEPTFYNIDELLKSTFGWYKNIYGTWLRAFGTGGEAILPDDNNEYIYTLAGFSPIITNVSYNLDCPSCVCNLNNSNWNLTGANISLPYNFDEQSIGENINLNESKIGENINLDDISLSCPGCPTCPTCPACNCQIDYSKLILASNETNNNWFESIDFESLDSYFNYVVGGIIGLILIIIIIIIWRKKLWKKLKKPKEKKAGLPSDKPGYLEPF